VHQGGLTATAAEELLQGTVSGDKNEILWSKFGINYNNEPEIFRKGSVVFREYALEPPLSAGNGTAGGKKSVDCGRDEEKEEENEEGSDIQAPVSKTQADKMSKARRKAKVVTKHVDIIRDEFWAQRPWLRSGKPGRPIVENMEP
jgi:tRNA(His) guanylyltransferase